ncbi:cutinase transcription factor 1 beta [Podospora aff. communis PSN243]|uniref:Cutinase transcription factor 1 beta n=1 Tax=Podospora aff. communis PSN243 TaxID=3040156 RepID=A0AAV9GFC5_9PEZI|nr:cutinase transcription factor 1 beta [Podospora aff. communis PSN243]
MGRTKLPRGSTSLEGISEEELKLLERAASILKTPVANLLSSVGSSHDATAPAPQQSVTEVEAEDPYIDDHDDEVPASPSPRGSESSVDVGDWQIPASDFRGIDKDIPDTYYDVNQFLDDSNLAHDYRSHHLITPSATGFVEPEFSIVSTSHAWPQHPTQQFGTPHPAAPPPTPQDSSARPHPRGSWELLDTTMVDQVSIQQAPETGDWAVIGSRQLRQATEVRKVDKFQIISVDPLQRQPQSRQQRRKPYDDRERQEDAGLTRGLTACIRCRMQKIKCKIDRENPKGNCVTCLGLSGPKVHNLPCLRYKLTASTLYRTGKAPGLEFTFRWPVMKLKDMDTWDMDNYETRTILVESDVCPVPLQLAVRRFIPIPGKDSMHRSWMDHKKGVKKTKETTPYAIVDMQKATADMREYVKNNVFSCMDFFLKGSDQLVKDTYEFARTHMQRTDSDEERKLLGSYFRLWFAIRRTATMEHIAGEERLGMVPEMEDRTCPLFGKIPLPPVMIQQLDMILTLGVLQPLQKQVLDDFQKLVLANNPRHWMTVYLITFMSLHSCAKISQENYNNARKQGLLRRYSIPNFIQERHHTANVFLSHYHYRTESANPFVQDWRKRHATPFSHMSVDEIHFLEKTKRMVKEREQIIKTNNENDLYEHELYFVAQMFEQNWQPRDTVIDRTEGTVNNVGLKKYA